MPTVRPSTSRSATVVPGARYALGFESLREEVTDQKLPIEGALPTWLEGQLLRNGPALFEAKGASLRHWFDGQAMIHRFGIGAGEIHYSNRFLDTPALRSLRDRGRVGYAEFATDPALSRLGRLLSRFNRKPNVNPSVNLQPERPAAPLGPWFATTEVPRVVAFDPVTLATAGVVSYDDALGGHFTTAHPHRTEGGDLVNYTVNFSRVSTYRLYRQAPGSRQRRRVAEVATDCPSYMHSFALTERYVVLAEFPLVVNPLSFVLHHRPFIGHYQWAPERGLRFSVIDLGDGSTRATAQADACFAFHHLNAFEAGGDIIVDLSAYPDAAVIDALYLDRLRAGRQDIPVAFPVRYRINLGSGALAMEPLGEESLELPQISYRRYNGRRYRFVYGVGAQGGRGTDFNNQLVKLDVDTGTTRTWHEPACYPGEPVFAANPGGNTEDAGVLLSVVLSATANRSFLVVLDAASLQELARAWLPHAVPFGLHGQFTATSPAN